jgi:molybdopterin-biosynthesis enzyme MoeA-like protein
MQQINWLKTVYIVPRQALFGELSDQEAQFYNVQQGQFQTKYDELRNLGVEVTSMLPTSDPRNLVPKLQTLKSTDRITIATGTLYEPSSDDMQKAMLIQTTNENLALAEAAYRDKRGE